MLKRKIELGMALLLLLAMIVAVRKLSLSVTNEAFEVQEYTVVLDAGHGGADPGKVGVNGALEKEINLQIAKKIKELLEQRGVNVIMTREDDQMQESKIADMKKRVAIMNEIAPELVVSIHQNSYSDARVRGAQVFYYKGSKDGKMAAECMQEILKVIDPENTREIKENDTFYLLKKTKSPTIIVECGFLSHPDECEKLTDEAYQKEIAKAICEGIIKWLDK